MMNIYREWCKGLYQIVHGNKTLFLLLNSAFFGLIGLTAWMAVRIFMLDRADWMICFIGYPAVFAGYLGGLFYLMNQE